MNDSLHEAILSGLLIDAWRAVRSDPNVDPFRRLDALAARVAEVQEAASALRMLADDLAVSTSPDTVRSRAASNDVARKAAEAKSKAWGLELERRADIRAASEAVDKAHAGIARATREHDRLVKSGGDDKSVVLAEGALAAWTDRLTAAQARLDSLTKGAK